jgi:hypothetical protein
MAGPNFSSVSRSWQMLTDPSLSPTSRSRGFGEIDPEFLLADEAPAETEQLSEPPDPHPISLRNLETEVRGSALSVRYHEGCADRDGTRTAPEAAATAGVWPLLLALLAESPWW